MFADDEPKDWEIEDEEPPEKLKKKWEEETGLRETVTCPSCRKQVLADSLTCIFCGSQVYQDSGLLGRIHKWIRQFFAHF